jgi:hypothetical protein
MAGLHPKPPGQGSDNRSKTLQFGDMKERNTFEILREWQLGVNTDKGVSIRKNFANMKMHFSSETFQRAPTLPDSM